MSSLPPEGPDAQRSNASCRAHTHAANGAAQPLEQGKAPFSRIQATVLLVLIAALGLGLFLTKHQRRLSAEPILIEGDAGLYALRINVNEASWEQLALLPGIGRHRAEAIVAHREEHGPFADIEDLENVSGIGPAISGAIADYVTFERFADD